MVDAEDDDYDDDGFGLVLVFPFCDYVILVGWLDDN